MTEFRQRIVDQLSGKQRQRAWMAMALVQQTPLLLLDEPTTYLDIAAQIDLLDLVWTLNRDEGRTIVMILHDFNLAARYADHIIAMKDGAVAAEETPHTVLNETPLRDDFNIEACITADPLTGHRRSCRLGPSRRPNSHAGGNTSLA